MGFGVEALCSEFFRGLGCQVLGSAGRCDAAGEDTLPPLRTFIRPTVARLRSLSPRCVLPAAWVELGWILGHVLFSLFGFIRHPIYMYIYI